MRFRSQCGATIVAALLVLGCGEESAVDLGTQTSDLTSTCGEPPGAYTFDGYPAYDFCTETSIFTDDGKETSTSNPGGWVKTNTSGYQCVELALRYFFFRWNVPHPWSPGFGSAYQMCTSVTAGVTKTTNPILGDLMVLPPNSTTTGCKTGPDGHVAVVNAINGNTITLMNQNITISGKARGAAWNFQRSCALCFLHAAANNPTTNQAPKGNLDQVDCSAAAGWSQDPDEPTKAIDVRVTFNGPNGGAGATAVTVNAGTDRADLCGAIGSCNHSFNLPVPLSLLDSTPHEVHAYGVDSQGGPLGELSNSPKTLNCPQTVPAGVKRHVTDPTVMTAWKFVPFSDLMKVADTVLDSLPTERDIAPAPVMIRSSTAPEIWLVDNGYRRHVPSPDVAANWRLDLGAAQVKTQAEVDAYPIGPDLRSRPVLLLGTGPAVWQVDDALPGVDAGQPAPGPDAAVLAPDADEVLDEDAAASDDAAIHVAADAGSHPVAHDGGTTDHGQVSAGCGCGATTTAGAAPLFLALGFALPLVGRRRSGARD